MPVSSSCILAIFYAGDFGWRFSKGQSSLSISIPAVFCLQQVVCGSSFFLPCAACSHLSAVAHPPPSTVRKPFHFSAALWRSKELWVCINFEEIDILIVKSIPGYFGQMQFDRPLF